MIMPGVRRSISLSHIKTLSTFLSPVSLHMKPVISEQIWNSSLPPINKFSTSQSLSSKQMVPFQEEKQPGALAVVKEKYTRLKDYIDFKLKVKPLINRSELLDAAYITYEEVVDQINVEQFFIEFNMPDTFASWFTVVELHLWMLSARIMREETVGYHARDMLTKAFFQDVVYRTSLLGPRASAYRKQQVATLGYQFTAAYYGYDEGIQSNDKVLAAIVWRRFFGFECDDARHIERIVKYIYVQLDRLCYLSFHEILWKRKELFLPLDEIQLD